MAILIDQTTRVVVQGVTGREGRLRSGLMMQAGTVISAGVTPGRRGESLRGVPVYNTVREAVATHPEINTSFILVPAALARDACFEAMDAGLRMIFLMPERVPHHDVLDIIAAARARGVVVIGPNSPGALSPGKAMVGGLGGRIEMAREAFRPGPIGIISRSGGNTMTLAYYLMKAGWGVSTAVGVGGDGFIGTSWRTLLELFERDDETKAVACYGEIGSVNEEEAAELLREGGFRKPLVAYIGGRYAREGMRFGHAGAVIAAGRGGAEDKRRALAEAGAVVIDHLGDVAEAVTHALAQRGVAPCMTEWPDPLPTL
jgi:succinyl-CoA synthetase alpha subunit